MLKTASLLFALSFLSVSVAPPALSMHGNAARIEAPAPPLLLAKKRCGLRSILIEGQCVKKRDVESFCGPGYHAQGGTCVSRYPAEPQQQTCPQGLVWSSAEGCHEDD